MNKKATTLHSEVSRIMEGVPKTTQAMLDRIAVANRDLQNDPEFLAEVERARFVNHLIVTMKKRGINANQLAKRMGKSRQYVHKILNEDARVSFGLKTMVQLCHVLGERLELQFRDCQSECRQQKYPQSTDIVAMVGESKPNKENKCPNHK